MRIPEIKRLEELLIEFLDEPKTRYGDEVEGQRIFNCPCCAEENGGVPDNKYNLETEKSKFFVLFLLSCSPRIRLSKGSGIS